MRLSNVFTNFESIDLQLRIITRTKVGDERVMTSKPVVLRVPITELPTYVGGVKIKTDILKQLTQPN